MTPQELTGRVALVTGASSGIGAAIAVHLASNGARVVVHFNSNSHGAAATLADCPPVPAGPHLRVQADLTDRDGIAELGRVVHENLGPVGLLVNNAGSLVRRSPIAEVSYDDIRTVIDLNLTGVALVTQAFIPDLVDQEGTVLNVASVAAYNGGGGGSVMYAAAKGAIVSFTRGLAKELAPQRVRVNAICPGVIETPFHEKFSSPSTMKTMVGTIPMARVGTPQECAESALFLLGPHSSYITGQVLHVNGGQYLG